MPAPSSRGILFHEVDSTRPFYGLVLVDAGGSGRTVVVDGSSWTCFVGNGHWLP